MKPTLTLLTALLFAPLAALHAADARPSEYDFTAMIRPVPAAAKFIDPDYYIWGGTMVRDDDGKCHLFPKFILDQDRGRGNQTYVYDYDPATCREHHIRYFQTITGLDHIIGGLLADLKKRGLAENTVILFGSDHGLLMGEYGMGGKGLLYDLAMKIPCIIHDPRTPKEQRGRQLDRLVSSLDYTRTILDYAGVEAPAQMEGRSLRPLVEGREVPWRDALFLESLFTLRDNPFQEGMRTTRWKYIRMYDGVTAFKEKDARPPSRTNAMRLTSSSWTAKRSVRRNSAGACSLPPAKRTKEA